jgi:hypothetical protein
MDLEVRWSCGQQNSEGLESIVHERGRPIDDGKDALMNKNTAGTGINQAGM